MNLEVRRMVEKLYNSLQTAVLTTSLPRE